MTKRIDTILDDLEKNREPGEVNKLMLALIAKFHGELQSGMMDIFYAIIKQDYADLEGDFLLLNKNASETITLNKHYSNKDLEKTRKEGVGFYEARTLKNVLIAGSRFGKRSYPIHLPSTDDIIKKIKLSKDDFIKADKEKKSLLNLGDYEFLKKNDKKHQ